MSASLGFRTRADAIRHLHGRGLPNVTIAHDLGMPHRTVAVRLAQLGLPPHRVKLTNSGPQRPPLIEVSADLVPLLRPHAARRSLSCAALAALIVDTVVAGSIIDAVLDDRDGGGDA